MAIITLTLEHFPTLIITKHIKTPFRPFNGGHVPILATIKYINGGIDKIIM